MKITDIIRLNNRILSYEVFPPKTSDSYDAVSNAVAEISQLSPAYMSVTYGAGGGRSQYTTKIAEEVLSYGITPLAHLTCISSSKNDVEEQIYKL